VNIIRPITENQCVIDIKNNFNPLSAVSRATISIFENADLSLDIEEYFESGKTNAYSYIRIVKDYNRYNFFGSDDYLNWDFFGSEEVEILSPKLQITLFSGSDIDYIINKINIHQLPTVEFRGLTPGDKISILEYGTSNILQTGIVPQNKSYTKLDFSKIEKNKNIQVVFSNATEDYFISGSMNICGGDIYQYDYYINIVDSENNPLSPEHINYMGGIAGGEVIKSYTFKNDSGTNFSACTLNITSKGDDSYLNVTMSDTETGTFGSSLNVGAINDTQTKTFYVKVTKDTTQKYADIQFNLQVETEV
jgi:hypothetical protein